MIIFKHIGIVVLSWAVVGAICLLVACENSDAPMATARNVVDFKRGSAPPSNRITKEQWSQTAIKVEVPAGEWRMLRLNAADLTPSGQDVTVLFAYQSSPSAQPWIGFGSQAISLPDNQAAGSSLFLIGGAPNNPLDITGVRSSWTSPDPEAIGFEFVYIVGSNNGPTTFYLGVGDFYAPASLTDYSPVQLIMGGVKVEDRQAEAQQLLQRPPLEARWESGTGGFGAWYFRRHDANGQLLVDKGGQYEFDESTEVAAPGNTHVMQHTHVTSRESFPGLGVFSYNFSAGPQTGIDQYSYSVVAPEYARADNKVYAGGTNLSAYSPPCELAASPCLPGVGVNYNHLAAYGSFPTSQGELQVKLDRTAAGRDGGNVEGYGAPISESAFSGVYFFAWGYIHADFGQIYGWNAGVVESPG